MGKAKKAEPFDPHNLSPQDQLKFEIAQELGLDSKVMESGRIGGLITKRKREMKNEALQQE